MSEGDRAIQARRRGDAVSLLPAAAAACRNAPPDDESLVNDKPK
jgi:hypothetical protein